jgi:hypothetical protein
MLISAIVGRWCMMVSERDNRRLFALKMTIIKMEAGKKVKINRLRTVAIKQMKSYIDEPDLA